MALAFGDASFYIALLLPTDSSHEHAVEPAATLEDEETVTPEGVLVEVLAYMSGRGPVARGAAVELVRRLQADGFTRIVSQTKELFDAGVDLFGRRLDKGYSHTDCVSMIVCQRLGIKEILTHDRHFEQEGFSILF